MQDVKITFRVRVFDDESRVIITEPAVTEPISFSVFMGIIRKLADFQEEENQHIKKLKDAGFDCGSSMSMLEAIQLLKLSNREAKNGSRKI